MHSNESSHNRLHTVGLAPFICALLNFERTKMQNVKDDAEQTLIPRGKCMLELIKIMGFRTEGDSVFVPPLESMAATSKGRAFGVILAALEIASELTGIGPEGLLDNFFNPMWSDNEWTGNVQLQFLIEAEQSTNLDGAGIDPDIKHRLVQVQTALVACAYAIQSLKADGDSSEAWDHACEAIHWLGLVQGSVAGKSMGREIGKSMFGKTGAKARHAEHRSMKRDTFEWLNVNMTPGRSKSSAAVEISSKQMKIGYDAALNWVNEWQKNQCSAGSP